jgi:SAM-dependent methyltransferase
METTRPEVVTISPVRLASEVIRRYRLDRHSRVLDVGCGRGELVARLRDRSVLAFGLIDGSTAPGQLVPGAEPPTLQPAILHQSVPFLVQSLDCILLRDSAIYRGPLTIPEACTATANLLACLKPGRSLLCVAQPQLTELERHLSRFPGTITRLELGGGALTTLLRRLGLRRASTPGAVQFTIPQEAISRLEWHRQARQAVSSFQPAGDVRMSASGSPAA